MDVLLINRALRILVPFLAGAVGTFLASDFPAVHAAFCGVS